MRQAYDYWQDQPGSILKRRRCGPEPPRGAGGRAGAPRAVVLGERASALFSCSRHGAFAHPSHVLSLPHPGAQRRPSAAGDGERAHPSARTRVTAVEFAPQPSRAAGRSLSLLAAINSFTLGMQHRKPDSAREASKHSGQENDGAYVRPVRCASKEPDSPHKPIATHAHSRAPSRLPWRGLRQTEVIRRQHQGSRSSNA